MGRKPKEETRPAEGEIGKAEIYLISLRDRESVKRRLERDGVANPDGAIEEATKRIKQVAVGIDRRLEIGKALKRLDDQYAAVSEFEMATSANDRVKMVEKALAITEKRAEFLGLAEAIDTEAVEETASSVTEERARQHIEALGLTPKGLPLEEEARILVDVITKTEWFRQWVLQGAEEPQKQGKNEKTKADGNGTRKASPESKGGRQRRAKGGAKKA